MYNCFENLKKVLHELPQNEGNNSHFQLSKNAVSNEMCGKKLDNSNLIDKITLHIFGVYARVTALRAAQNALVGRMQPAGRSLSTSGLAKQLLVINVSNINMNYVISLKKFIIYFGL